MSDHNKNLIGKVKWYNLDLHYGFISTKINEQNKDIFVHRNNIKTNINYKCLFKGEYVLFDIETKNNKTKSINIRGINNDLLLCESNPDLLKKFILGKYIEKTNPSLSYFKMSNS